MVGARGCGGGRKATFPACSGRLTMAEQTSTVKISGRAGNLVGYRSPASVASEKSYARLHQPDVADPKTSRQLLQRAVTASVTRAYSQLRPVLSGFFEGLADGAPTFRRFLSVNMRQLREDILDDLALRPDAAAQLGCVVAPDSYACTPAPIIISDGTLEQQFLRHSSDGEQQLVNFFQPPRDLQLLGAWLLDCNLTRGDAFTIVCLGATDVDGQWPSRFGVLASQPSTQMSFVRLSLIQSALTSTARASRSVVGDAFTVECSACASLVDISQMPIPQFALTFSGVLPAAVSGFMGVVRTNSQSQKASSCRLQTLQSDGMLGFCSQTGIKSSFLLNAWLPRPDRLGQSSLVLEGGRIR